jgi:molybdopterin synthase catalytic subunit
MGERSFIIEPAEFLTDRPVPHTRIGEITASWAGDHRIGGIVSFAGVVRADDTPEGPVTAIEFTAHRSMAQRSLSELTERCASAYESPVLRVYLEHALGTVAVGECPLVIVVGAGHRPEAFGLCRDILEALKAEVPIYGRELTEGGGHQWKVNR